MIKTQFNKLAIGDGFMFNGFAYRKSTPLTAIRLLETRKPMCYFEAWVVVEVAGD